MRSRAEARCDARQPLCVMSLFWLLVLSLVGLQQVDCVPDEPEHPCVPGSTMYTDFEKVAPSGACTDDSQCLWVLIPSLV